MSRIVSTLLIALGAGCAPYVEVQSQLVEQSSRGVAALGQSLEQKSQIVARYHAAQRERHDDAFDEDVRRRDASHLPADWDIEPRRAYAVAVDALTAARFASVQADEINRRNAQATRDALERLRWLQSIQVRWVSFGRENANERD